MMIEIINTQQSIRKKLDAIRPYVLTPLVSPLVQPEYVFCREAIKLTGDGMFGSQWTGKELQATWWQPSPEAVYFELWRTCLVAYEKLRLKPSIPVSLSSSTHSGVKSETSEEFDARKARLMEICTENLANIPENIRQLQIEWEANSLAFDRLMKVIRWLGDKCRSGAIRGAFQFKNFPDLHEDLKKDRWNGLNDLNRWAENGGYTTSQNGVKYHTFVFMHRADLYRELSTLQHAPLVIDQSDLSKLAPDLQLAVRLALKLELFDPKAMGDKVLKRKITDAAKLRGREIMPTKAGQMSATMRYPVSPIASPKKK